MNESHLPKTDSIQELAQFWDTHDVTEFEDELEVVDQRVFERNVGITVQLETSDAQALQKLANTLGIQESELVLQWVLEKIHST